MTGLEIRWWMKRPRRLEIGSNKEADRWCFSGQRSQDQTHLLQGQGLPKAHSTQGHPIQGGQGTRYRRRSGEHWLIDPGIALRTRKASLWSQTVRLWWSDQACVPQEGEDNKEGRVEIGVHKLQDKGTIGVEAMQALRVGVRSLHCGPWAATNDWICTNISPFIVVTRRPRVRRWCSKCATIHIFLQSGYVHWGICWQGLGVIVGLAGRTAQ